MRSSLQDPARVAEREGRDQRLRRLGFDGYEDYLRSGAWQAVKDAYRGSSLPQNCALCGQAEDVHLHHRTYDRVGEERLSDLVPLCDHCHRLVHELVKRGDLPGLDAPDLQVLVDAGRARLNRDRRAEREARQRSEFTEHAPVSMVDRRVRSLARRMIAVVTSAARGGVDVEGDLDEIDQIVKRLRRKRRSTL